MLGTKTRWCGQYWIERFGEHYTKRFMQISWSEACDKPATWPLCFCHAVHAGTRSGPLEGEKLDGWMENYFSQEKQSTGTIPQWPQEQNITLDVLCFNIGPLSVFTDCVFPPLIRPYSCKWGGGGEVLCVREWKTGHKWLEEAEPEPKRPRSSPWLLELSL